MPEPLTLRFERRLPRPVERVWSYLTDDTLRGLWLAAGPMLLAPGGRYEMSWRNDRLSAAADKPPARFEDFHPTLRGRVLECEPTHKLAYSWGEGPEASDVTFELVPDGNQTLLTLTHAHFPFVGLMADSAAGWHAHLAILDDVLAERRPRSFWSTWAAVSAEYVRRLGDGE